MSKKTSLGHNPLAYSLKSHASFDFIKNTQDTSDAGTVEKSNQKKVTSYYLHEETIDRIKAVAEQKGESYSSVVNDFLKVMLDKENQKE
ncbi:MAG: hypothetical protein RIE52_09020 [Balneola sp.]|jgi:hypothetical protein